MLAQSCGKRESRPERGPWPWQCIALAWHFMARPRHGHGSARHWHGNPWHGHYTVITVPGTGMALSGMAC